jgi:UDP-3-O-[3-hydroxymyristoyl] glucosamine N-acyltransferase
MKLAALAAHLGATLDGDPDAEVTSAAGIEDALPGQLTFLANPKYTPLARTTRASAVLVEPAFEPIATATLRIANPYLAFARALEVLYQAPAYPPGIHPTAVIAPTATIGPGAHIGAYAVIGDHVVLGPHATVLPHVVLYPYAHIGSHFFAHAHAVVREGCRLGDHVILQNGVIIGADGFGFARKFPPTTGAPHTASGLDSETWVEPPHNPAWHKILQTGPAVLEDHVEVQANACVDRASVGETRIHAGAKIDNLVQVGHGSSVGADSLLCAQVGLAGSTHVGRNVILAGQVGVAGHCTIGDGAIATAQSGIPSDVAPGATVSGTPAFENRKWLRSAAIFQRLPEILRDLKGNNSNKKST